MKQLLLILIMAVSGWSATTPITGIEVNPSGWNVHVTISSISSGGIFRIDHGPNHTHLKYAISLCKSDLALMM